MKTTNSQHSHIARIITVLVSALVLTLIWIGAARETAPAHAFRNHSDISRTVMDSPVNSIFTLHVGTSPDYWPFEYYSGTQVIGHDIDLMNAIGAELNATIIYTYVDWGNIFTGLEQGEYDAIISGITIVPAREDFIDFTLPYLAYDENDSLGTLGIGVQQGDQDLRRQFNEALYQLRQDGTLAAIIAGISSDLPESNARLPDWPAIVSDTETTMSYPSTTGGYTTSLSVPSEAVTDPILLVYSSVDTPTVPSNFSLIGQAFNLDAFQEGTYVEGYVFQQPISITLQYDGSDIEIRDERLLTLNIWDSIDNQWIDAATTCEPTSIYQRLPEQDQVTVAVCHLSEFVFLEQIPLLLPFIIRSP